MEIIAKLISAYIISSIILNIVAAGDNSIRSILIDSGKAVIIYSCIVTTVLII